MNLVRWNQNSHLAGRGSDRLSSSCTHGRTAFDYSLLFVFRSLSGTFVVQFLFFFDCHNSLLFDFVSNWFDFSILYLIEMFTSFTSWVIQCLLRSVRATWPENTTEFIRILYVSHKSAVFTQGIYIDFRPKSFGFATKCIILCEYK